MSPPRRTDTTPADVADRSDRRHADDVEASGNADRRDLADSRALQEAQHPTPCPELERRWRWGLKAATCAAVLVGAGWGALWYQVGRAYERDTARQVETARLDARLNAQEATFTAAALDMRRTLAALRSTSPIVPFTP